MSRRASNAVKIGWGKLGTDLAEDVDVSAACVPRLGPTSRSWWISACRCGVRTRSGSGRAMAAHRVYFLEEPLSPDDLEGWRTFGRAFADADSNG